MQAEEYLSQARWTVLKSTDCSNATHSLLHRNLGLLYMAKENHEEARYHLANDVSEHPCDPGCFPGQFRSVFLYLSISLTVLLTLTLSGTAVETQF